MKENKKIKSTCCETVGTTTYTHITPKKTVRHDTTKAVSLCVSFHIA
jgi:hypothetical protein